MPQIPHDYDLNFWIGVGDKFHTVRVESMPNRDLAIVAGLNAFFEWMKTAEECPLPRAALQYWEDHRQNPMMTFQDVQADLERQWGFQFDARQVEKDAPRGSDDRGKPKSDSGSPRSPRVQENDKGDDDLDIVTILKRRHAEQVARLKAIGAEIAAKEKLQERVEHDITRLELMLGSIVNLEPPKEISNGHKGRSKRTRAVSGKNPRKIQQARDRGTGCDENRDSDIPGRATTGGIPGGVSAGDSRSNGDLGSGIVE
jgi:hypothetical protein